MLSLAKSMGIRCPTDGQVSSSNSIMAKHFFMVGKLLAFLNVLAQIKFEISKFSYTQYSFSILAFTTE